MYTKSHLYKLYDNAVEKSNNNRKGNPFDNDDDDNLSLALLTTTSSIAEQHFTYESFKASQATTNLRRIGQEANDNSTIKSFMMPNKMLNPLTSILLAINICK